MQVPYNQPGQPISYTQIQQPIQPTLQVIPQVFARSSIQQPGLSTPRTHVQTAASTYVQQPSTPIPGVSTVPICTTPQVTMTPISQDIPQMTIHQLGPMV